MVSKGMQKRLVREAENITNEFKDVFELQVVDELRNIWHISFTCVEGTIYAGEKYTLQFRFDEKYPFEAPEVMFVGKPPEHEHVYSCGYICLSTLANDWTPALQTS